MADGALLMLDKESAHVHHLDLETEKVVRTYDADTQKVQDIFPVHKFAQQSTEQTFLAINEKAAFVMDPRKGDKAKARSYEYSSNPHLSCLATDGDGHFVAGSRDGEFRLFDGEANKDGDMKKCKNLLPGLGDAVVHVDVTSCGSWILGTCDKYLLLIDAKLGGGATAFGKVMPADSRPKPIKLRLKPEDVARMDLGRAKFTPARFDSNERGVADQRIVTSIGSVAVVWDFPKVKRGRVTAYSLKPMEDFIVATDLLCRDKKVVVAYDDGVHALVPR